MSAFIRRGRETPGVEQLAAIEQIFIVDQTPRTPVVGSGTSALLLVGEFEDGPFNDPREVFGEQNELSQFGGFGHQYGDLPYQNPCARIHLSENWNGNGFLKGKFLRPNRKFICRVDTSVGEVRFSLAAALRSDQGPFDLEPGDQLSITTDTGTASTTAVAATAAQKDAVGATYPNAITGGERFGITIDALPEVVVTFLPGDNTLANTIIRINAALGYTAASDNAGQLRITGITRGTAGNVTLRDIDTGTLAEIGMNTTPAAGTGNVANVDAVTATEVATLTNVGAITAINGAAVITPDQRVIFYRSGSATGTISIAAGSMATALGVTTATTITANVGDEDSIPAGTRVRNSGGDEWVTMVTTAIPEGTASAPSNGTYDVKVRPGTDDGSATLATAGTVTTVVDFPSNRFVEVTNPANLSAALTEPQIDARYQDAFDATIDVTKVTVETNHSLSARRSEAVVRAGRLNAETASQEGNFGRKFHTRAPLGYSSDQAISDVANFRVDRVFYTYPGFTVTIPEIQELGTAGGTGFTADGSITIGADGPLAYINSVLRPEQNPGIDTGLLGFVTGIEEIAGLDPTISLYTAFKAAGICAPRRARNGNFVFQSEVTAELTAGRTTQKRRKMADFLQDTIADLLLPDSKRLMTDARSASIDSNIDEFLTGLLSLDAPDLQRIADFSVTNTTAENPDLQARGISVRIVQVRMLSSNDSFLVQTEIGEGVVITREV